MQRSLHLQRILHLVVMMGLLILLTNSATVSAQPTQALVEDWRATDFNFTSSMMDTDLAITCMFWATPLPQIS